MEQISTQKCHGGTIGVYRHQSAETKCPMKFSLFLPPQAENGKVPVLFWLSGLTCTEENFTTKAGAYKGAAALGLAIVAPDTSPRGEDVPNDEAYDLGQGAGFYVDATQEPWAKNFRMESYIARELPALLGSKFSSLDTRKIGIFGHSMGGHGALTLFFRHRDVFRSVSAFAPIVAPTYVPWGQKAFTAYLGDRKEIWAKHDSCALALMSKSVPDILIDVGSADQFLDTQLKPAAFEGVCKKAGIPLRLRKQAGYDHSYFFIQSFIDDHLKHHADQLSALVV
jgi:S-formylglutathione hydrolase